MRAAWRSLACGLIGAAALVSLAGCGNPNGHTYTEGSPTPARIHTVVKKYHNGVLHSAQNGHIAITYNDGIRDPNGSVVVSVTQSSLKGRGPARSALAAFGHDSLTGKVGETYDAKTDGIGLSGTGVLTAKRGHAGSVCVSFSGKSVPPSGRDQFVQGSFHLLGGSGRGARLRGSGMFLAVQPSGLPSEQGYQQPFSFKLYVDFRQASLGPPRVLTSACRHAGTLPPTPKVTFDGFAFAPKAAQNGALPTGTRVYPNGSTITGSVGCGAANNLYAVLSYSGPTGETAYFSYDGAVAGKGGGSQPVKPGANDILVVASPPNDSYQLQGSVAAPNSTKSIALAGSVTLARTC
jgi:hypothetical protein